MKRYILYLSVILCLCACGKQTKPTIDYLPCQTEVGAGWGFIGSDGEVFLSGTYTNQPSPVSSDMFTVKNGDFYQLYRLSERKPELLLDSLMMAGVPAFGRVPICREAGKIEVVDADGKSVFVLDHLEGQTVVSAAPQYTYGYLEIETVNSLGVHHSALVDPDGQMVLPPHYSDLLVLNEDLIWVMQETVDNSQNDSTSEVRRTTYFVDRKGRMQADKPRTLTDPQKVLAQFGAKTEYPTTANGWTRIDYIDGFGYVGSKELKMAVLNPKTWEAEGEQVYRIAWQPEEEQQVASDTYAYDRTAKAIMNAFQQELSSRGLTIPVSAPYVTSIVVTPAEEYNSYATAHTIIWQEHDFQIEVVAQFDTTLIRQKFKIEHTALENMYGQPVEMNKRKEDGYEYNPEADLISVDMTCLIDSASTKIVMEKVKKMVSQQYKKRENLYLNGEQVFTLTSTPGRIVFHLERDPQVIAREQAAAQAAQDSAMQVEQGKYDAAIDSAMQAVDKQDSINKTIKTEQQ